MPSMEPAHVHHIVRIAQGRVALVGGTQALQALGLSPLRFDDGHQLVNLLDWRISSCSSALARCNAPGHEP